MALVVIGSIALAEGAAEIDWAAGKVGQSKALPLKASLGKRIKAIVEAQLKDAVGAKFCGIKKISDGYSLQTTLRNHLYEATVYQPFKLIALKPGEFSVREFYVLTKNPWPLPGHVIIPAGVMIGHENDEFWIGKKAGLPPASSKKSRAKIQARFLKKEEALFKLLGRDISMHDPFSRTKTVYYKIRVFRPEDSEPSLERLEERVKSMVVKRVRNGKITSLYALKKDISALRYPGVTVAVDFSLPGRGTGGTGIAVVEAKVGAVEPDVTQQRRYGMSDMKWYYDPGFLAYGVKDGRVHVLRLDVTCGIERPRKNPAIPNPA